MVPTSGGKEWGYVAAVDELLLGSETRPRATFRYQTMDTEWLIWRDRMPVVCSEPLRYGPPHRQAALAHEPPKA